MWDGKAGGQLPQRHRAKAIQLISGRQFTLSCPWKAGQCPSAKNSKKDYYKGEKTKEVGPIRVREDGSFEANTHIVIGMDHKREVTLSALSNPSRVVIDIAK